MDAQLNFYSNDRVSPLTLNRSRGPQRPTARKKQADSTNITSISLELRNFWYFDMLCILNATYFLQFFEL